jgi:hypothetical protein
MAIGFFYGKIDYNTTADLSEEVKELVYEYRNNLPFDVRPIIELDPNGDVVLDQLRTKELSRSVDHLLSSHLLKKMEVEDIEDLKQLSQFLKKALEEERIIIGFGD